MLLFKKEKRVVTLVLEHIDKTDECVAAVADAVKAFVSGKPEEAADAANRINSLETEADRLLREIRELLYSGAYLPHIRGDLYHLMSAVDKIANKAEACFAFVNYQKPAIAEEHEAEIIAIMDLTAGCYREFRKAIRTFFKPKGKVDKMREHTQQVGELESLIDDNERTLTARIFDSDMPLSARLHAHQLVAKIAGISDMIEDASDELELVSLKSVV